MAYRNSKKRNFVFLFLKRWSWVRPSSNHCHNFVVVYFRFTKISDKRWTLTGSRVTNWAVTRIKTDIWLVVDSYCTCITSLWVNANYANVEVVSPNQPFVWALSRQCALLQSSQIPDSPNIWSNRLGSRWRKYNGRHTVQPPLLSKVPLLLITTWQRIGSTCMVCMARNHRSFGRWAILVLVTV